MVATRCPAPVERARPPPAGVDFRHDRPPVSDGRRPRGAVPATPAVDGDRHGRATILAEGVGLGTPQSPDGAPIARPTSSGDAPDKADPPSEPWQPSPATLLALAEERLLALVEERLLALAGERLLAAKRRGRNRVVGPEVRDAASVMAAER